MGKGAKERGEACSEACKASCCRYVATRIEPPRTKVDWDEIYWFLCHENVEVFIEARKWYVLFATACKNLDTSSRCVRYATRPHVCRDHKEENCEFWGVEEGKVSLRTPEDLARYMKGRKIGLRMAWDDPDEKAGYGARLRGPPRKGRSSRAVRSRR
jgi:hypothetical protein